MAPELVNVREFQQLAREALPKMYYDFYAGGAEDEFSLKENMEAFRRITYYFFTDDVLIVVHKRRDVTAAIVDRAERLGYKALVLTVDVPRIGQREEDLRNKMVAPKLMNFGGLFSTEHESDGGSA